MDPDPAEELFQTPSPDLYATLHLPSTCTAAEIRSAYRKLALKYHPDKLPPSVKSDPEAEAAARLEFDRIGLAYKVLGDEQRRKRWDETGRTDEGFVAGDGQEWSDYFKNLWKEEVNAATIEEFLTKYKGSDEELADLSKHYLESSGSLSHILMNTMGCGSGKSTLLEDEQRYISRLDAAIKSGALPSFPQWNKDKKDEKARKRRVKEAEGEAKEAEEMAKELGVYDDLFGHRTTASGSGSTSRGGTSTSKKRKSHMPDANGDEPDEGDLSSLKALIQKRGQSKFESMIVALEAKAKAEDAKEKARKKEGRSGAKRKGQGKKFQQVVDPDHQDEPSETEEEETHARKKTKNAEPSEEEFQRIRTEIDARKAAAEAKPKRNAAPRAAAKAKGRKS